MESLSPSQLTLKHLGLAVPEIVASPGSAVPKVEKTAELEALVMLGFAGFTVDQIAQNTGLSSMYVRNVLAQSWAKEKLRALGEKMDPKQLVPEMISRGAIKAVEYMTELIGDTKAPANLRLKAATEFLDRHIGKATVSVRLERPVNPEGMEEIDQELRELAAKEKDLIGRPKVRELPRPVIDIVV